jgi:hypothetical protein
MSAASAQIVGFNNNLTKIVAKLSTSNPSCYTIKGNNTVVFWGVSEAVLATIFALELDPNGYSGGSFITTIINDLQTNVSASGNNNITATQKYHRNVTNMSSQTINYNTAISYNAVIDTIGTGGDARYKINGGSTVGSVIDYVTANFSGQTTVNQQKYISGAFISTIFCPPGTASILVGPASMPCPAPGSGGSGVIQVPGVNSPLY